MSNYIDPGQPYEDLLHEFFARKPREVDGVANTSVRYHRKRLLEKIYGRFEFKNIPDTWDMDYFIQELFLPGHVCITDTEMGVIPLASGLTGKGVFNQPTECIIANPVLGNLRRKIGIDCEIIRIQYDYKGVQDLVTRYAVLLAMCDSSIAVNLMNTKVSWIFGASSKGQAQTLKKIYDDIAMGKPAVFTSEQNSALIKENLYSMPVKNMFIADDIQLLKRKIINEFLTDVGINNTNLDKRERLTDDEVNANNEEVLANIMHWYDNIKEGVKRVNAMFNLDISVSIVDYSDIGRGRQEEKEVGEIDEPSELS